MGIVERRVERQRLAIVEDGFLLAVEVFEQDREIQGEQGAGVLTTPPGRRADLLGIPGRR